jgi:hypothetical protein
LSQDQLQYRALLRAQGTANADLFGAPRHRVSHHAVNDAGFFLQQPESETDLAAWRPSFVQPAKPAALSVAHSARLWVSRPKQ